VSEQLNRKCPARNTKVQLSTPYTNPVPQYTALQTDRQTDYVIMPMQNMTVQLSTPYTDPEPQYTLSDRQTDRQITLQRVMNCAARVIYNCSR